MSAISNNNNNNKQQRANQNELLSPNISDGQMLSGGQQRRKSTLSGNGFFIDYSCTRRRSSAAAARHLQRFGSGGHVSPAAAAAATVSPRRLGGGSFCAGSQPSSPRSRAHSRSGAASLSPMAAASNQRRLTCSSQFLVPPSLALHAPSALAGSRKTSIFDPAGHSLGSAHLRSMRRKSTMVTSMPAFDCRDVVNRTSAASFMPATDSSTAKMLSLARSAAALSNKKGTAGGGGGRKLIRDHVPVIGCSPTSIRASLAALDETRRYEKLLKKLKRHEKSRLKRDKKRQKQRQQEQEQELELELDDGSRRPQQESLNFRRKSLRAIKDGAATALLLLRQNNKQHQHLNKTVDNTIEDLSVSSMSLSHAFDDSVSCADGRFYSRQDTSDSSIGCSLDDNVARDDDDDDEEDDDMSDERYELDNDELFLDDNTMVNLNELLPSGGTESTTAAAAAATTTNENNKANSGWNGRSSSSSSNNLVKFAIRRLTGSRRWRRPRAQMQQDKNKNNNSNSNSNNNTGQNADYWHYYYYLRENSLDNIDDLPISGSGVGCGSLASGGGGGGGGSASLGENERRIRLHMNYSLARVEILNDNRGHSRASCPNGLAAPQPSQATPTKQPSAASDSGAAINSAQELDELGSEDEEEHLFDQASDVSLSLSTSSSCTQQAAPADTGSGGGGAGAGDDSASESSADDSVGEFRQNSASSIFSSSVAASAVALASGSASVTGSISGGSASVASNSVSASTSASASPSNLSFSSKSSLNVNSGNSRRWQQQHSMSSQSVAALKSCSPIRPNRIHQQHQQPRRKRKEQQQQQQHQDGCRNRGGAELSQQNKNKIGGGNSADDECTSLECLMDRHRLSPSPMRPKSADLSVGRQHRSASGELLAATSASLSPSLSSSSPPAAATTIAAATTTTTVAAAAAITKRSQRSASFRISHTSTRSRKQQAGQVGQQQQPDNNNNTTATEEEELDDFERFRRAHRAGYSQNGQPAPQVPAIEGPKRVGGGRDLRGSSVKSVRGGSSSNLPRSSMVTATGTSPSSSNNTRKLAAAAAKRQAGGRSREVSRTSMSWDTLNSANWPDEDDKQPLDDKGGFVARFLLKPRQQHHYQQQQQVPKQEPAVKRTSSARLSGRHHERPPIGSYSNPTRFDQPQLRGETAGNSTLNGQHQTTSGSGIGEVMRPRNDNYKASERQRRQRGRGRDDESGQGRPLIWPNDGGAGSSQRRSKGVSLGCQTATDDGRSPLHMTVGSSLSQHQQGQHSQQRPVVEGESTRLAKTNQPRSFSLRMARNSHWPIQQQQQQHHLDKASSNEGPASAAQQSNIATRLIRSNESRSRLEPDTSSHRVRASSMGASSGAYAANQAAAITSQLTPGTIDDSCRRETTNFLNSREHIHQHQSSSISSSNSSSIHQHQHKTNDNQQRNDPSGTTQNDDVRGRGRNNHLVSRKQEQDFELLAKNSFTCLLVGSRQTGKRTIVKCFVKLVNEFKLAADEYRKEKILTKLMDCSDRLQELAKQQAELEQQETERERHQSLIGSGGGGAGSSCGNRRRSRVNSWLGGKLLTGYLQPAVASSKLRLHSLVPTSNTPNSLLSAPDQQQRRHTAVGPAGGFRLCGGVRGEQTNPACQTGALQLLSRDGIGRHSTKERCRPTEFLAPNMSRLNCCNKSDFNINYLDAEVVGGCPSGGQAREYIPMNQLQVPSGGGPPIQSHSFALSTSSLYRKSGGERIPSGAIVVQPISPTRICINNNLETSVSTSPAKSSQRRRRSSAARQTHQHKNRLIARRQQTTVSLKEINRRRIRVRFSTRRQLSDKYSNFLDATRCSESGDHLLDPCQLPDSIMVVYSVNDRESFNYAKSLVSQLRSIKEKQEIPLPIILVANKIDLERAKVVRPEEGRALAKRNECKYMEISCTVGFKLDNLLVGLRTQLVLRHHTTLNSILRSSPSANNNNFTSKQQQGRAPASVASAASAAAAAAAKDQMQVQEESKSRCRDNSAPSGNILVRFYKRYVMDYCEQDFDCDNFSKL